MRWTAIGIVCILATLQLAYAQSRSSTLCIEQSTCGSCIAAGAECAWCKQEKFDGERCDGLQNLHTSGCDDDFVIRPDHSMEYDQNLPPQDPEPRTDTEAIQLTPQEVTVKLRPNKPFKLQVTFKQAENYPVDLYYLMDLSKSMEDDKQKLAELGVLLAEEMSKITENFRLGFGSFVDKKTMPYVSTVPKSLIEPCTGCAAPYGFKNQLELNEDTSRFSDEVLAAPISGNLDSPEGGFDAIMQSVVCDNEIGWRDASRKMLLFSTDAGFHYAGDGKLGGIVKPNDGSCHMVDHYYSESLSQDYPSISQLSHKIKEKNVNVIFAVTQNQIGIYGKLMEFIEGSAVGELANDSSNIVHLVQDNYNKISSKVELKKRGTEDKDLFVTFRSKCSSEEEWKETGSCADLRIGQNVTFEVSIEAKSCPELRDQWKQSFEIYPVGLTEKLTVNYELMCECECELPQFDVENSPKCNLTGTYECGACTCNPGRYGKFCECDGSSLASDDYDAACKLTNTSKVCEGNGECICGTCDCYPIRAISTGDFNPSIKYKGKYCECDDYSCDNYQGQLCGGPMRGSCVCGICVCNPGYTGEDCSCATSQDTCMAANGVLCNGVGTCSCGRCICTKDSFFKGPTCEDCDSCPGKCDVHKECAQCKAFGTGPYDKDYCDANCTHVTTVEEVDRSDEGGKKLCRFRDEDDCFFVFTYEYDTDKVEVQTEKECPKPVNVLAIVLGIILAILFIGLALLLIWKLLVTIHDRREFAKFEKERQNAKWDMGENPVYKPATSTFKNPTYGQ